jgi:hypothetical protein
MNALPTVLRLPVPAAVLTLLCGAVNPCRAGDPPADYLADRGEGMPTSLLGTYVENGQWLIYPFYEYTTSNAFEYKPRELGVPGDLDYLGNLETHEFDLYLAHAWTDRLMFELEGQLYTQANFERATNDTSTVPARLKESGLGEIEGQFRYRWSAETRRRPEFFSFAELVFPFQRSKHLIGAQDWGGELGFGAIKGFTWGTLTLRATIAYDDRTFEPGEYAIEWVKRISPRWRCATMLEGESDELSLVAEAQYFFTKHAYLKLNSGFGLTPKAPDIAPEIGIMMTLGE